VFVHDPAVAATVDAARAVGLPPTTRHLLTLPELADLAAPPAVRQRLRTTLTDIATQVGAFVARRRPDLREADWDLLAWACLGAAISISFQRIELPRLEYTDLLAGIIDRVVDTDLDAGPARSRRSHHRERSTGATSCSPPPSPPSARPSSSHRGSMAGCDRRYSAQSPRCFPDFARSASAWW
jgi:hypothetical protein